MPKQDNPALAQDNPKDDTPFDFKTTPPVAMEESIKPSTPGVEKTVDNTWSYFCRQIDLCHQKEDRLYILHSLGERLKEMFEVEKMDKVIPQE